ncbi:hypothetical protein TMatcc_010509 [Talaromyces marneffei ATCC 18224]
MSITHTQRKPNAKQRPIRKGLSKPFYNLTNIPRCARVEQQRRTKFHLRASPTIDDACLPPSSFI